MSKNSFRSRILKKGEIVIKSEVLHSCKSPLGEADVAQRLLSGQRGHHMPLWCVLWKTSSHPTDKQPTSPGACLCGSVVLGKVTKCSVVMLAEKSNNVRNINWRFSAAPPPRRH